LPTWAQAFLTDRHSEYHLSAASPWEIAIKSRLGKLRLKPRLDALPDFLVSLGITILSINERQAPTAIDPGRKHTIRLTGRPYRNVGSRNCASSQTDRALVSHAAAAKTLFRFA
jgi:hypothetical protein